MVALLTKIGNTKEITILTKENNAVILRHNKFELLSSVLREGITKL